MRRAETSGRSDQPSALLRALADPEPIGGLMPRFIMMHKTEPTTRFMLVRKADHASEAGVPFTPEVRAELGKLTREMAQAGVLLAEAQLQPSSTGARLKFTGASGS